MLTRKNMRTVWLSNLDSARGKLYRRCGALPPAAVFDAGAISGAIGIGVASRFCKAAVGGAGCGRRPARAAGGALRAGVSAVPHVSTQCKFAEAVFAAVAVGAAPVGVCAAPAYVHASIAPHATSEILSIFPLTRIANPSVGAIQPRNFYHESRHMARIWIFTPANQPQSASAASLRQILSSFTI